MSRCPPEGGVAEEIRLCAGAQIQHPLTEGTRVNNLFLILIVLFVALFAFIHITERYAKPMSAEQTAKISRWILPLVGISIVIGLLRQFL